MRIDYHDFSGYVFDGGDDGVFADAQGPRRISNATPMQRHLNNVYLDARFISTVCAFCLENSTAGVATQSRATILGTMADHFRTFAILAKNFLVTHRLRRCISGEQK